MAFEGMLSKVHVFSLLRLLFLALKNQQKMDNLYFLQQVSGNVSYDIIC